MDSIPYLGQSFATKKHSLMQRSIGTFDATMLVAGSMIGSGVFLVSADIARTVGSPFLLLAVWAVTGLLTLIAAVSYGELAGMFPHAGGQYVYLRQAYNPMAGFLYGWTLFTVIQTGTIAAVAMAFAKYTAVLIPSVGEQNTILNIGVFSINAAQVLAISTIILLTAINARGVSLGTIIQNLFTTTKIVSVLALIVVCLVFGGGPASTPVATTLAPTVPMDVWPLMVAMAVAMVGSLFSSDAWNNITFVAGEVRSPERTIPRALVLGVGLVTVLYLLLNLGYINVLSMDSIANAPSDRVAEAATTAVLGTAGAAVMAVLIMISTFGCNNGLILSGARAYYAMAHDGLFFDNARKLNANDVPANALWIQAAWASVLCLSGKYGDLLDYVVTAVLVFYILTIGGIIRLRSTMPDVPRPIRARGYPVLPIMYIVAALFIIGALLVEKPEYTIRGLAIVALGIPVYWVRHIIARRQAGA
jgi:basic amino acid/polyamine antiporter, APA family